MNAISPKKHQTISSTHQIRNNSIQNSIPLNQLQTHLLNIWTSYNVDQTYQNLFLIFIESFKDFKEQYKIIETQIKKTYQKNSLYFLLQQNLDLRLQIKKEIQTQIIYETKNKNYQKLNKLEIILKELCDKLKNLRRINLLISETILKIFEDFKMTSRQSKIGSIGKKYIQIFIKIDLDNQILKQSFLNGFILFQKGYDPFFLVHYEQIMKSANPGNLKKYKPIQQLFDINITYVYRLMRAQQKMLKYMLLIDQTNAEQKERKQVINRQKLLKSQNKKQKKGMSSVAGLPSIKRFGYTENDNFSKASTIKQFGPRFLLKHSKFEKDQQQDNDSQCTSCVRKKHRSLKPLTSGQYHNQLYSNSEVFYTPKQQNRNKSLNIFAKNGHLNSIKNQVAIQSFQTEDQPLLNKQKMKNYFKYKGNLEPLQNRKDIDQNIQKKWNSQKLKNMRGYLKPIKTQQSEQLNQEEDENQQNNFPYIYKKSMNKNNDLMDSPLYVSLKKSKLADEEIQYLVKRSREQRLQRQDRRKDKKKLRYIEQDKQDTKNRKDKKNLSPKRYMQRSRQKADQKNKKKQRKGSRKQQISQQNSQYSDQNKSQISNSQILQQSSQNQEDSSKYNNDNHQNNRVQQDHQQQSQEQQSSQPSQKNKKKQKKNKYQESQKQKKNKQNKSQNTRKVEEKLKLKKQINNQKEYQERKQRTAYPLKKKKDYNDSQTQMQQKQKEKKSRSKNLILPNQRSKSRVSQPARLSQQAKLSSKQSRSKKIKRQEEQQISQEEEPQERQRSKHKKERDRGEKQAEGKNGKRKDKQKSEKKNSNSKQIKNKNFGNKRMEDGQQSQENSQQQKGKQLQSGQDAISQQLQQSSQEEQLDQTKPPQKKSSRTQPPIKSSSNTNTRTPQNSSSLKPSKQVFPSNSHQNRKTNNSSSQKISSPEKKNILQKSPLSNNIDNNQSTKSINNLNSSSKIKLVPGKLNFIDFQNYLKTKKVLSSYQNSFKQNLNFIISSASNTQTYLNQFILNQQLATFALCSPTSSGNIVIYLWAPIEGVCDQKTSLFFFKKYIDYIQKQTTFKSIVYRGQQIPQIISQNFQLYKEKNYIKKRITQITRQSFQFQYFFSMQISNISFFQSSKQSLLYSDQIVPLSDKNSWCNPCLLNSIQKDFPNQFSQEWMIDEKLKSIKEANFILQKDSYDTFEVGQEKQMNFQNISLSRAMITTVPKQGFIANEGFMIVIGKNLNLEDKSKKINKIQLLNDTILYFSQGFKSVQQLAMYLQNNKNKLKQQNVKFAFKMFSKQLYGRYLVSDNKLIKGKAYYSNWDLNFAWRDQIPGKIIHNSQTLRQKYGPQNFMCLIQKQNILTLGVQISKQDFLY